ncbi:dicarboxylate/amino acid:cation symporter [Gimibacter soli]|uniref:Cation:dicarboxylase symporter family transporter n=1 Tax=Gimibacter soli TaxID=3024400 RepID=A0AAE9XM67_9PROT|nr:cation:dicarboxylase symporter family transporter [Gimibacter soli]WCL52582.1 cation:dicarboxylase symporter family transporter [Gimibacter soli]
MSSSMRILLALFLGVAGGALLQAYLPHWVSDVEALTGPVGAMWLAGLRMAVVPLIFALIVTGIGTATEAAAAGGMVARSLGLFLFLLVVSALIGVILMPAFLSMMPVDPAAAETLRASVASTATIPETPGLGDWFRSLIPSNILASAANGDSLQIVIFAIIFGFAITRLPEGPRVMLTDFFRAVGDAMMQIVHWVIWVAPVGIFALAFSLGAGADAALAEALLSYIVMISVLCIICGLVIYPLVGWFSGVKVGDFARAAASAQVVAASTRSSLASLPATIESADRLGIDKRVSGVVLPMAVSLLRVTSASANLGVAIFIAHIYGVEPSMTTLLAAGALSVLVSLTIVSLPAQANLYIVIPPLCAVFGVPPEILAVLVAVETFPDTFRTISNVTANLGVSAIVANRDKKKNETD